MFTTLAFAAALSLTPTQSGELTLKNPRSVYWGLGPTRPDNNLQPGDVFILAFDIENLKTDESGKVNFSFAIEVFEKGKDKPVFKQAATPTEDVLALGGKSRPFWAMVITGVDQPLGEYTCTVTIEDIRAKTKKSVTEKFTLEKRKFGIVQFVASSDGAAEAPTPMLGCVGQALWLHFVMTTFERDKKTEQPQLKVEITVKDKTGKSTTDKPHTIEYKSGIDPKHSGVGVSFRLALTREGDYTVEVKATDILAKKEATQSFPLTVVKNPSK